MALVLRNVGKSFGAPPTTVLQGISLTIDDGEFVALTGRSGSGKSTLLYLASTLDTASTGEVELDGRDTAKMTSRELHEFRNRRMGFIFQFHYLLPDLTSLENVLMPALKSGERSLREPAARKLLGEFGLSDKLHRLPSQLSGGEQQRVAIARALIMEPQYLFADEPTGNLDSVNGATVMDIIRRVNKDHGTTVIMVTHDPDFAAQARRQVHLVDGRIAVTER